MKLFIFHIGCQFGERLLNQTDNSSQALEKEGVVSHGCYIFS